VNFLAPLFLLGAAAIAAPILFHLIRRTTRERIEFPSLRFLQPTPPRITRRSRLENLLLLVLRCTALALVAFAFARPYLQRPTPPVAADGTASRTLLLIDTSASMRRSGLWADAVARASAHVRGAGPNDQVAILAFDRSPRVVVSFSQWLETPANNRVAVALDALGKLSPSWLPTALGPALVRAADEIHEGEADAGRIRRRVILVSDFQEGARLDPLQSFEWPRDVEVVSDILRPARPGNASLQWLPDPPDADRAAEPTLRVRISNSADARSERFKVAWAAQDSGPPLTTPLDVYVPPGQSRVVTLGAPTNSPNADRVVLTGDDEPFDNVVHVIPPQPVEIRVAYMGQDAKGEAREPLFFLQRALPESRRQTAKVDVLAPNGVPAPGSLAAARVVFVTAPVPDATADALRNAAEKGAVVVFAPTTAAAAPALGRLVAQAGLGLSDERPASHALLASLDFRHPLLAPFNDPRFSDFTRIHWWRYRRVTGALPSQARVVARFDTGDPAWIDFPVGRGRVVFMASSWSVADSQFALSSKFIPWLFGVLDLSGAGVEPPAHPKVGDAIPLPAGRTSTLAVHQPDGAVVSVAPEAPRFEVNMPGTYRLGDALRVGVNLDPSEGRTAPLPADRLESLGVRVDAATSSRAVEPGRPQGAPPAAEAEGRQKMWRWLILAALAVLVVESWVAGFQARRSPPVSNVEPIPSSPVVA
jgi:hypothetical protein